MAENSKIEWTTHSWNPWRGCTKVSPGCTNCYADTMSKRNPKTLGVWGPKGNRVVAAESAWREPLKWDRLAKEAGERHRVFCASLADVFEDWQGPMLNSAGQELQHEHMGNAGEPPAMMTMQDVRNRLFSLIDATPNLDWLLLTKRPENIAKMMPPYFPGGYIAEAGRMNQEGPRPNLWLGVSVENQAAADERIPELLKIPAAIRFLSVEPLLGPIEFSNASKRADAIQQLGKKALSGIDWVIVGGESGPNCRPCRPEWIRSIVKQCKAANVACFVKQMGGNVVTRNDMVEDCFNNGESGWPDPDVEYDIHGFREDYQGADCRIRLTDKKGGDMAEFPKDLRIREFPEAAL